MDPLHQRLARVALATVGKYGFCLAGGYAVQAHGFLDRPSEDVDLFTTATAEQHLPTAVAAVIQAYRRPPSTRRAVPDTRLAEINQRRLDTGQLAS